MHLLMSLQMALGALRQNRMRTALTMLGMIIGVGAVIAMVALGTGAQAQVEEQVKTTGTHLITVRAGNVSRGGVSQGMGAATTLTTADVEAIQRAVPGVQYLAAGVSSREQVVVGNRNWSTVIQGTDVALPDIRSWPIGVGGFFTRQHVQSAAKVAVLGSIVRAELFGEGSDPVGERVRIRGQVFTVIGVMTPKGSGAFGEDQDDVIFAPYTTVQKKLLGRTGTHIQEILVSAVAADDVPRVAADIEAVLRVAHEIWRGEEDDFLVRTQAEMMQLRTETTTTMTGLLAAIAAVSLVVGGIGIMNIMLVSVTERTREIGLRLAVGARRRDVLEQFLAEAVVLSATGGLVGVVLGFGVSEGFARLLAWPSVVPYEAVLGALLVAVGTGVFFGLYPARQAAHLDPIDALRYE